jgi:hypothetical protein
MERPCLNDKRRRPLQDDTTTTPPCPRVTSRAERVAGPRGAISGLRSSPSASRSHRPLELGPDRARAVRGRHGPTQASARRHVTAACGIEHAGSGGPRDANCWRIASSGFRRCYLGAKFVEMSKSHWFPAGVPFTQLMKCTMALPVKGFPCETSPIGAYSRA